MTSTTRWALSIAVAFSLAVPAAAVGQTVVRRSDPPAGGSSGGGSSGSSSSGSSSSGESRGGSTSSGGEVRHSPPPPLPTLDPPQQRQSGRSSSGSSGSSSRGSAVTRGGTTTTTSGGSTTGSTRSRTSGSSSSTVGRSGAVSSRTPSGGGGLRDRAGRPIEGTAIPRPALGSSPGGPIFIINPWNNWYWGGGFGYGYGYNSRFACGGFCYSRWGYDPYWYDPFYRYNRFYPYYPYDPYDPYYSGDPGYRDDRDEPARIVGSLRIKANEKSAKVYIDGVLVGMVDDFDGLTNHLELDAGPHQMEIRADGYQPHVVDVIVREGKTLTERVALKKVQ